MSKSKVIAAIVVVVGIGLAVGWWGSSRTPSGPPPPTNDLIQTAAPSNPSVAVNPLTVNTTKPTISRTNPVIAVRPAPMPGTNAVGIPDWEEKVDNILTSEIPDNEKAKKMLEMFPQLSPEAQE